jgi:hypothetical protein
VSWRNHKFLTRQSDRWNRQHWAQGVIEAEERERCKKLDTKNERGIIVNRTSNHCNGNTDASGEDCLAEHKWSDCGCET